MTRRLLVGLAFLVAPLGALADLLPPEAAAAAKRLEQNPRAFDRFDQYCADKGPGAACVIPGSSFAGGGEGLCRSEINSNTGTIDLGCQRSEGVLIDRQLPAGGFIAGDGLCRDGQPVGAERPVWNCKPPAATPVDRFCAGKTVGSACVVELRHGGQWERHDGVCRSVTEREGFYHLGRRVATRVVVQCEPPGEMVARTFTPVGTLKKLLQ